MTRTKNNTLFAGWTRSGLFMVAAALVLAATTSHAKISGVTLTDGAIVNLTAKVGHISVADGGSIYSWGYAVNGGTMQLPGPTLIVNQGDTISITLTNNLPLAAGNVSIVFPGMTVTTTDGVDGELTKEAVPGGTVTYSVTAEEPGTYQYHSGTQPDLQVEMGLYGAIVVRPTSQANCAYSHIGTCFDREYLYLLSEIDIDIHHAAELQAAGDGPIVLPAGAYQSEYWLMNGRAGPDTMAPDGTTVLATQPYGSLTRMHPGEKLLLRIVGAGREMHPFHTHGNHVRVLAKDGNLMVNGTGGLTGPTLFTVPTLPGGTVDAIFQWTGKDLGWDMYGHKASDGVPCEDTNDDGYNDNTNGVDMEWCADHEVAIPVDLPALSSLAFGGFYSGSPYLGALGSLPPGEGGLNAGAGFAYMWHSHTERELVNNDVFPGGMMTMLIVEAPFVEIVE